LIAGGRSLNQLRRELRPAWNDDARAKRIWGDRTAVATYVASLSADLANMARETGLDTLGYLLEMVRLEAESSARQSPAPNGRR
jgi:hypothetical protein